MLKNIISYIFIYILLVGCENINGPTENCSDCILEMSIPELEIDENAYYHLPFNNEYIQTFTTIQVDVGHEYEYVGWTSDTQHCVDMWNYTDCNNVVNGSSYSDWDGLAYTIMGVHSEHIGDTVKVYCGYYDWYGTQYLDSLEVIIDE